MHLAAGHSPEKINEIACDTEVLRLLGLPEDAIGHSFVLQYTAGTKRMEKEMTVCGIWEGKKYEQSAYMLASKPLWRRFWQTVTETMHGFAQRVIAFAAVLPAKKILQGS